jgi:para-nitrobenzyl esterase
MAGVVAYRRPALIERAHSDYKRRIASKAMQRRESVVSTTGGAVEGRWDEGVSAFMGIPYAEPPTADRRWAPPVPIRSWEGTRRAHAAGPVPPQGPARLQAAMGPMEAPAPGEDCLNLNVWTPAPSSSERLPVLVFLHGGGYLSGAGSATWYDGSAMARRGPAVVVTLNYRLGALGYLFLPPSATGGAPVANLGLQDQRLALEWVRANADAFGGDSQRITVFGQSGGGHSLLAVRKMPDGEALFRRAILQSAPLGMPAARADAAGRVTDMFMEAAGIPRADMERLRSLPVADVLTAQVEVLKRTAAPGRLEPPFHLVVDGETLTEDPIVGAVEGGTGDLDLLLGFTADEARAFLAFDDRLWRLDRSALIEMVRKGQGEHAALRLERYADHAGSEPAAAALSDLVGDRVFVDPAIRLAERTAAAGANVHMFRFSWSSDALGGRLGACHTIELPFVFNNPAAWTHAPMLGTADLEALSELREAVQDAWLAFASTGKPAHPGLPSWDAYREGAPAAMDFDDTPRLVSDPTSGRHALWGVPGAEGAAGAVGRS